jgi:hypothetical protein
VVVHHDDFRDDDLEVGGSYQELWCAERHIKIHKQGPSHSFFDVVNDGRLSKTDKEEEEEAGGKETPNSALAKDDEQGFEMQEHQNSHGHCPNNRPDKRYSVDPSGFDDPLRPREGRDLMWANVNMTLVGHGDSKDKKILDGVWGDVPTKQVTAIMG